MKKLIVNLKLFSIDSEEEEGGKDGESKATVESVLISLVDVSTQRTVKAFHGNEELEDIEIKPR